MFSIVIVNYDGARYLPECLQAIRRQTCAGGVEIIVVNNRSTDGSLELLRAQADVRVIDPGGNVGFSRGQNLGILASRGRYVLCLNFDCFLEPDFLDRVAEVFESRPGVGGVSGRLRKLVGGEKSELLDSTGIWFGRCIPADRGEWLPDGPAWADGGAIFGPSGAAGCYRREALESIRYEDEYFDEEFFMFCEDIDLAWRLNLAGWQSYYEPAALAYHERGSTRKKSRWEQAKYLIRGNRNRLAAMYKNLRWHEDIRRFGRRLVFQEVYQTVALARRRLAVATIIAAAFLAAFWMVLTHRRIREKRRFIQGRLANRSFDLGFDWPLVQPRGCRKLNLYDLPDAPRAGAALWEPSTVEAQNLAPTRASEVRGAMAAGVSRKRDPQLILRLPQHAQSAASELLEFDLYASGAGFGQIIWLRDGQHCISEEFPVHPGRRRYLLDLDSLAIPPGAGDPAVRSGPVDCLRIDPCQTNGVTLGLFRTRLLSRANHRNRRSQIPNPK
jgi:GT2 family glycosyltransferase